MSDALTIDRFRELAETYGGAVARWPEAVRPAALRMAEDPVARAILDEAGTLDATLDLWSVPAPERSFVERVVGSAPLRRTRRRVRLWWSAIGVATALAGAAAGSLAAAATTVDEPAEMGTSFGDIGGQEG